MALLLRAAATVWIRYRYDPDTGRAWPRFAGRSAQTRPAAGIGAFVRSAEAGRVFVATYAADGSFWFAIGPERWEPDAVTFTVVHDPLDGRRRFSFRCGPVTRTLTYRSTASDSWARLDPAYDEIDREHDDFLLFLSRMLPDAGWREAMKQRWLAGAGPA